MAALEGAPAGAGSMVPRTLAQPHWLAVSEALPAGVQLDREAVELTAPRNAVWAHADYEVAQAQFEAVNAVAHARLELAQAKRAVVHAHVPPPQHLRAERSETWDSGVRGMLDGIGLLWGGGGRPRYDPRSPGADELHA